VYDGTATRLGGLDLIGQMRKVRRQNRWKKFNQDEKSVSARGYRI